MVKPSVGELVCASAAVALLACSASKPEEPALQPASRAQVEAPEPASESEVHQAMNDVLAQVACDRLGGQFLPLKSGGEGSEGAKPEAVEGRLWIQRCRGERLKDDVQLVFGGRAWRWVSRESQKLGARFEVNQYARFEADVTATGEAYVDYLDQKSIVKIAFEPSQPLRASVTPIGRLEARATGPWSSVLGGLSDLVGPSPDQRATAKLQQQARQQFAGKLRAGFTAAVDLCTRQVHTTFGEFEGERLPEPPLPARGAPYLESSRVRLFGGGIDVAGPFEAKTPVTARVRLDSGTPIRARLVCLADAARVASAFLQGDAVPQVEALASLLVLQGETQSMQARADCSIALLTSALTEGGTSALAYMVQSAGAKGKPLVDCSRSRKP